MARALAGLARCARAPVAVAAMAVLVAGCFDVQSADLFVLTRTGQGPKLTLLVNDGGTIRCDGAKAKPISNSALITARDLSDNLATDAQNRLTIPKAPGSIYYYRIRLQQGTVSFPDRASAGRKVLAQAELFAAQTAQTDCGRSG
ncbi:MAG TPA: hypothetical protein VHV28_14435 [Solirubrobacteraceae bacterium]|nr:hypothetical protein [Solirubrobacteraceae bacterium]